MNTVKILLVDDSEGMLRHISGLLGRRNWVVRTATDMAKAIHSFQHGKPNAVLADFVLEGGRTGLETIEAIFAVCPEGAPRPAVAIMTMGALEPKDEARIKELGASVIHKPVKGKEDDFLQDIECWLRDAKLY